VKSLSADWILPVGDPPVEGGVVRWDEATGQIAEIARGRGERHHDEAVIVPGFVNTHSHLEYASYAGFGDGETFSRWLEIHIGRKRLLDAAGMADIARLGAAASLATGITTIADYSFSGAAAGAMQELGLRGTVYLEVFACEPADAERQLREKRERLDESALVRLGVSPHAPYTCSLDVYRWCLTLGVPVGTHLAESDAENAWLERGDGPFAQLGPMLVGPTGSRAVGTLEPVLGPELLCAHCVEVTPAEISLLAERDVPVAHCPRSNALLGCGVAPLEQLRSAGVRVGLGTDSPASTPGFDVFEEMRAAVYAARGRAARPDALLASDALRLATAGAAEALQLDTTVGTLGPGKQADLAVVSLAGSPYTPVEDPAAAVVFGGSPDRVLETIVDGHTRYRKEEFDWQEVRSTANAARRRMLAQEA
jgi:cytosine/adenosine deaminase-related metal-dependent hydrolase